MRWRVRYTEQFVGRFGELSHGQRTLVEVGLRKIILSEDPRLLSHHLERRAYFCNWSHRVRANLLIVFQIPKTSLTFLSTGTHAQAYRPKP